MLALVLALVTQQAERAESLLAVGRAHFAGRVVGRYPALEAFRAAARLVPDNPEPLYWQMKVGFYLGSDEGDVIAREAILRILALTPDHQDVWHRFGALYHDAKIWRRADRALAFHATDPLAMERRAEIAIALEEPDRADSLLEEVLRFRAPRVPAYLLRAEANFLGGHDSAGYRWYDSALAYVDSDSGDAMWDRIWMIATPEEMVAQDRSPAGARRALLDQFWAKRDPNLLTPHNERIAEHFRRFAYARRYFRLLHPLNTFHRSPRWRALIMQTQRDFLQARGQHLADPYPGLESDRLYAAMRQLPEINPGVTNSSAVTGLDARGLIYMRHGPPDQLLRGYFDPLRPYGNAENALDVEGWLYRTREGMLSIGFRRGSGSSDARMAGGDFIFVPTNRRQAASIAIALRTDRTALPAPREVQGWNASFKSDVPGLTDVFFKAVGDSSAAVLWGAGDRALRAAQAGAGLLQLSVPPGRFDMGVDVLRDAALGRARSTIVVPRFTARELGLSSLAVASGSAVLDRLATLRAMPADLTYVAGTPLVTYVEIYGLSTDPNGRSHYRMRYSFAPRRSFVSRLLPGGGRTIVFEFDRESLSNNTIEQLVIEPDKLPPGRYQVMVAVTDLTRNVKSESVALDISIR
jgi:hypothetical protein